MAHSPVGDVSSTADAMDLGDSLSDADVPAVVDIRVHYLSASCYLRIPSTDTVSSLMQLAQLVFGFVGTGFYLEEDGVRLQPANSTMEPIFAPSVEIRGVVVSVIRQI